MNSKWRDNLRDRMESHVEPTPDGLWDGIEQAMKKERSTVLPIQKVKEVSWGNRFRAVAAAAIIVLLMGDYTLNRYNEHVMPFAQQVKVTQQADEANVLASALIATSRKEQSGADTTKQASLPVEKEVAAVDSVRVVAAEQYIESNNEVAIENPMSALAKNTPNYKPGYSWNTRFSEQVNKQDFTKQLEQDTPKKDIPKWEANVYAVNLGPSSPNKEEGYANLMRGSITVNEESLDTTTTEQKSYGSIISNNKNNTVYTNINHKKPITFGISLSYSLNERVSIRSGLVYTLLSSTLRSGSQHNYYSSKQTLHNIGIPVNICYRAFKHNHMSLYVTGGALAEKNISGKMTTDYIVEGQKESSGTENVEIEPLQWSVNGAAGIQYSLLRNVGIYAEPGVSYYFSNGSKNETIYKEKPVNFSLRVGFVIGLN